MAGSANALARLAKNLLERFRSEEEPSALGTTQAAAAARIADLERVEPTLERRNAVLKHQRDQARGTEVSREAGRHAASRAAPRA